ncbi:MAG: TIGR03618 family F420-dependent PPOX class oxidoreductase [Chloroflexi bacterium]|nr:MAG: TIGR03618 family F420-dependent PPOX class oxidoreductase [Chloroflexota bacterium]
MARSRTTQQLTEQDLELFQATNFAHVATLSEDGSPHAVVVWVDAADGKVRFNSAEHAVKVKHLRRDPRVAVSVHGQDDPYRAVTVLGSAVMTTEGAEEHIDLLTRKYTDRDRYPAEWRAANEVRVLIEVAPRSILRYGY